MADKCHGGEEMPEEAYDVPSRVGKNQPTGLSPGSPLEEHGSLTRHQLLSCLELGKALTAELDPARIFDTILNKVSALLPAEHWSLLLLDEATGELQFELSVGLDRS